MLESFAWRLPQVTQEIQVYFSTTVKETISCHKIPNFSENFRQNNMPIAGRYLKQGKNFAAFQITIEEALHILACPFPWALSFQNIKISIPSASLMLTNKQTKNISTHFPWNLLLWTSLLVLFSSFWSSLIFLFLN